MVSLENESVCSFFGYFFSFFIASSFSYYVKEAVLSWSEFRKQPTEMEKPDSIHLPVLANYSDRPYRPSHQNISLDPPCGEEEGSHAYPDGRSLKGVGGFCC